VAEAVAASRSYCGVARHLGYPSRSAGTMVKKWITEYGIPTDRVDGLAVQDVTESLGYT
jgi:hypothetical protein